MKILAIDIGGTAIKYGITDENFNVCEFYEIPSEAKLGRDHLMLKVLSIVGTYYGGVDCVRTKRLLAMHVLSDYCKRNCRCNQ